ncbi:MAG: LacI family DNA-binding transcriptional regulator, partial [bacterium]
RGCLKMWVTIRDVARVAGVSVATVSRVLNNSSYPVAEKTRKRVLKTAKDLDFQPNKLAAGLKLEKSAAIGLIFPSFMGSTFYSQIFHAIEDEATGKGYGIILGSSYGHPEKEELLIDLLRERRVEGLIIIPSSYNVDLKYYQRLREKIPFVFVDRYLPEIDADRVTTDNVKGTYIAVRHLIKLGHERIALLSGPEAPCTSIQDRIKGYEKALGEFGIGFRKIIETEKDLNKPKRCAYKAMKSFLSSEFGISALFAVNDGIAIGALRAIREAGLKVPHDIAVIGYNDDEIAPFASVPLTTVAQRKEEMGKIAVGLLLERIRQKKGMPRHILLEPRLVVRASCGAKSFSRNTVGVLTEKR